MTIKNRFQELLNKEKESDIRGALASILRDKDPEGVWETEMQLGSGRADICSINSYTIIETKSKGQLNEKKNKEQLKEYANGFYDKYFSDWVSNQERRVKSIKCLLTDGLTWYFWDYDSVKRNFKNMTSKTFSIIDIKLVSDFIDSEIISRWEDVTRFKIPSIKNLIDTDFNHNLKELEKLLSIEGVDKRKEFDTKFKLWRRTLQRTGIIPADSHRMQQDVFLKHSFIVIVARLIIDYIENGYNKNYLEKINDGFFAWVIEFERGKKVVSKLYEVIRSYQWQFTVIDVLKHLYHGLIDPKERKEFGEFYTPDKLAKEVVLEVLDDDWLDDAIVRAYKILNGNNVDDKHLGVLDPACGSGTFLFHSAKRILERINEKHKLLIYKNGAIVSLLVHGIDVHPIAVEMARATLRMSIPIKGKINFKIFLGSSMQEDTDIPNDSTVGFSVPTAKEGDYIFLGQKLWEHPKFSVMLTQLNDAIINNEGFPKYEWEGDKNDPYYNNFSHTFHKEYTTFCSDLDYTIKEQGNHVWETYINNYLIIKTLLSKGVGRLVGNPPWQVRNTANKTARDRRIKEIAKEEGIYTKTGSPQSNVDLGGGTKCQNNTVVSWDYS